MLFSSTVLISLARNILDLSGTTITLLMAFLAYQMTACEFEDENFMKMQQSPHSVNRDDLKCRLCRNRVMLVHTFGRSNLDLIMI